MDETSSRFVDQLAVEKLLTEKLSTVNHYPSAVPSELLENAFEEYCRPLEAVAEKTVSKKIQPGETSYLATMETPMSIEHIENRSFQIYEHPAEKEQGVILLVHGLFEDNREIYAFLIKELNRLGYSTFVTTLPYHYERQPKESRYSGELFFSADIKCTKNAFLQAVLEIRQCYDWLEKAYSVPVYVVGFSIGGTVSMAAAGASPKMDGVCIINPAAALSTQVWNTALFKTIRKDFESAGWNEADFYRVLSTFDPFLLSKCPFTTKRLLMLHGRYDQVTPPSEYESLVKRWDVTHAIAYKAGHLNMLRVPRLAEDIARFFDNLASKEQSTAQGGAH